jgi:hypothetical protein
MGKALGQGGKSGGLGKVHERCSPAADLCSLFDPDCQDINPIA